MPPTVHCIRHAQGYHNLSSENEHKYHDPSLTPLGRTQCMRLRSTFPNHSDITTVISSPIRRTIQTTLLGLGPAIDSKQLKLLLAPRAQETSDKPSDTGSDLADLKREFGADMLDSRRMEDGWNSNEGGWKMDGGNVERHAREIRKVIRDMEDGHVALVTHGGFLHYFTEDWSDNPGAEGETGWKNTEFRSYTFVDGPGAHLKETEESRDRRAEKSVGGWRPEDDEVENGGHEEGEEIDEHVNEKIHGKEKGNGYTNGDVNGHV